MYKFSVYLYSGQSFYFRGGMESRGCSKNVRCRLKFYNLCDDGLIYKCSQMIQFFAIIYLLMLRPVS